MKHGVLCLILLLPSATAAAQEVAGRIGGRVLSTDSMPLVDVDVTVSSPQLPGTRRAVTDRTGRFLVTALPVGVYRVRARRVGFRPVAVEGVPVRLGTTVNLARISLESQAVIELEEIVVTAEAAGLDLASTGDRTTFDIATLDALPLERNFREIMLLAPQSVPSFLGDAINVGGATGFENTYYADGINITSPISGNTSMDLPYNFIQQIEVRTGGSTAEDARALGGVVNVVTPNGGNRFQGTVFGFWSDDAVQTTARTAAGATQTGFSFRDAGMNLSGPVLRDRLWFFVAYNRNYQRRDHAYAFGDLADTRRQDLFAGKLLWRAGHRTFATLTLLGDPSRVEPIGIPALASGVPQNPEVVESSGRTGGIGGSLRVQYAVSPDILLEASASRMDREESDEPRTSAGRQSSYSDAVTGTLSGGRGDAIRIISRRRSFATDVTWHRASHTLRAGVAYQELLNDMSFEGGRSTAGGNIHRTDTSSYSWHWYDIANGRGRSRNPAVYVQDAWRLTPRVLVNAGFRWSRQDMINAVANTFVFRIHDGLQPRVGVVVHPDPHGQQRVFASYGRVVQQLALWSAQEYGPGVESLMTFPQDPRSDTAGSTLVYGISYGAGTPADRDLRGQRSDEWTVGYGRMLGGSLALTVRAVRRTLVEAVANGADTAFAFLWGNPGRGALAHFQKPSRTYDALEIVLEHARPGPTWYQVSYVLSRNRGNYPGVYLADWRISGVTSNYGPIFIYPSQHADGFGLLPNDRTHVAKLLASRRFSAGLDIGLSFLVASGTPLSEYGAIPEAPPPFRGFASPRGTAGRTPTIWDLGIRTTYELPVARSTNLRSRVLLDLQHIGSPRRAVDYEQLHYTCLDTTNGNQSCPNAAYGAVTQFQPPMTARLGLTVDF